MCINIILMIIVAILELFHICGAIGKIPLYTSFEMRAAYMRGVYQLTNTQIAFAFIFAWFGILFSILNIIILNKLVVACQDLHSNMLVVLGYNQQIGVIFNPNLS